MILTSSLGRSLADKRSMAAYYLVVRAFLVTRFQAEHFKGIASSGLSGLLAFAIEKMDGYVHFFLQFSYQFDNFFSH